MSISPSYREATGVAAVIQVFVVFCSGLILDGGAIGQLCVMALPPFWAATAILIWRRPQQPTRFDLSFIRIGYLLIVIATFFSLRSSGTFEASCDFLPVRPNCSSI